MITKVNPTFWLNKLYRYTQGLESKSIDTAQVTEFLKANYCEFISYDESEYMDDLKNLINCFSSCDHLFFLNVLRKLTTEDDHLILTSAIGNYGKFLATLFYKNNSLREISSATTFNKSNIVFVIKGPFNLAHMSFAKSFYAGYKISKSKKINPIFVFLDDIPPPPIKKISVCLNKLDTYEKMKHLCKIIHENQIYTLIWPSVSQTVSLFLGSRLAPQQIYWSARYRNHLFDTVDKYFFGARSSVKNIQYGGVTWCYGRFFVAEWRNLDIVNSDTTLTNESDINWQQFFKRKKSQGFMLSATISSDRKMQCKSFHKVILKLLQENKNMYYFFTSREKNSSLEQHLSANNMQNRFKRIPWIHRMSPLLKYIDLILDSFPVGASHALCYSIQSKTPFISLRTPENLNSSLLETIYPIGKVHGLDLAQYGFVEDQTQFIELANKLISNESKNLRTNLLRNQTRILNSCLNNLHGMYEDFSTHILS